MKNYNNTKTIKLYPRKNKPVVHTVEITVICHTSLYTRIKRYIRNCFIVAGKNWDSGQALFAQRQETLNNEYN